jgi:O-antigen ligase
LALYPLALLFPILLLLAWRARRFELPRVAVPLVAFLLVAMGATLIGTLYAPLDLRGQSFEGRALRAWFSVAVGLIFFLSAYRMNRNQDDLKRSLKWMYAGLAASIVWGGIQTLAFTTPIFDEAVIESIQLTFSLRGLPSNQRILGFAFEPAWLADQVVIYYYPWLMAAILTGYRISRHRWLEPSLLILGTVLLIFTFSRGGVLNAIIVIAAIILLTGREWLRKIWDWFVRPFQQRPVPSGKSSRETKLRGSLVRISLLAAIVFGLAGTWSVFSQNRYFSSFLEYESTTDLYEYMLDVSAGPRLGYAAAGLNIYSDYPWMGVGLGASSLYLYDYLPDWALTNLPEINRRLSPDSNIVANTKNLYVRLLSETGIIGFWFFSAFYLSLLADIRALFVSKKAELRFIAIAGLFIWLAVALRNFTQDSLTFPIMWVGFGTVLGLTASNHK